MRDTSQVDLDALLAQEASSLDAIEQLLKTISQTEVTSRIAQLEADRKAKSVLTTEQLEKLQKSEVKVKQDSDRKQGMHGHDK